MASPIEQIKERLGVADVVQSYLKLQKAGSNFKANCPFHAEKTPSFFVSPARNIWHCFGCGATGDIIEFVKKMEGVEFPEALQILGQRAGVEIKKEDPRLRNERTRLLQLVESASLFYHNKLNGSSGVLDYLEKRGLRKDTIKNFRLGYISAEWQGVYNFLRDKGYSAAEMEKAGLVIKKTVSLDAALPSIDRYYDRFRSRIMFPLFDNSGRVVGFSGRIFEKDFLRDSASSQRDSAAPAKYVNTPQTILYDKSRLLYGFDRAKTALRQKDVCLIVEGQMDLIMCHQSGIDFAVAVSGTALGQHHLNSIGRLTKNLVTAFDMDKAGSMATKRGVDLALRNSFEIKVAVLPFGKDPADVAKENPESLKESIKNAKHIISFYLDSLENNADSRLMKKEAGEAVLPYVAMIQSPMEKSHWVAEVAKKLKMREEPIWEEMKKIAKTGYAPKKEKAAENLHKPRSRKELLEERILGISFWKQGEFLETIKEAAVCFSADNEGLLRMILNNENSKKETEQTDEKRQECSFKLAFEAELLYSGIKNLEDELKSLIFELKREWLKNKLETVAFRIKDIEQTADKKGLSEQLAEFQNISKELSQLIRKS